MAKPKPVNWQIITDGYLYDFVGDIIAKYYGEIIDVSYILMWRHNVKMDADGFLLLADITKSADKVRELRPHDVIIGINKDVWSMLNIDQKSALIDAQVARIAVCKDKQGNIKEDDKARTIYRLRRPEVVDDDDNLRRRYGAGLQDIYEFVCEELSRGKAEEGSYVADVMQSS